MTRQHQIITSNYLSKEMDIFAILFAFCCSTAYPNCTWHVKISDNSQYALININMSNKNTKCKIWVNRLLQLAIYKHISWRSFTSNCHQSLQVKMRRIICFLSRHHTSNWYLTWYIPRTTFRTHLMATKNYKGLPPIFAAPDEEIRPYSVVLPHLWLVSGTTCFHSY